MKKAYNKYKKRLQVINIHTKECDLITIEHYLIDRDFINGPCYRLKEYDYYFFRCFVWELKIIYKSIKTFILHTKITNAIVSIISTVIGGLILYLLIEFIINKK
jgi:hypothetical protein